MKIGVIVESFRTDLEGGLRQAAQLGLDGVQIYGTQGESRWDKLDAAGRAGLKRRMADMGLELSAVCADFGGYGFQKAPDNAQKVQDSKKVIDLALDLGTRIVTTHIGVVPPDPKHPRRAVMAAALEEVGRYAASVGATFAIETGPERSDVLARFLDAIGPGAGLGVNFDPANLIMVFNEPIPPAVRNLGRYIVHTHAKDGENLKMVDAEVLYTAFAEGGIEGFHATEYIRETPLGAGRVPWKEYLAALRKVGFDGYLTIEREVGEDPAADIRLAAGFLKGLLGK